MAKTNAFETDYLELLFNNTPITDIGDAGGLLKSVADGNFYIRLTTTTPTDATKGAEATYTGYVAGGVAVPRTTGGWTVSGTSQVANAAAIAFAASTGSDTITHFEIWKDNVSALEADRIFWGALDAPLAVTSGVTPEFAIGALVITED